MKKFPRSAVLCGILALVCALTVTVLAASYDSSEDPLISLSYLKNVFRPSLVKEYEAEITRLENMIEALSDGRELPPDTETDAENPEDPEMETEPDTAPEETETPPVIPAAAVLYEVLELKWGDCVFAASPCDIMLRAGSAVCIAPDATQGISDYTDAVEVYDGENLTKNHMCLIPRGDGRGIMATADSVFIMIRGDYTIVKAE